MYGMVCHHGWLSKPFPSFFLYMTLLDYLADMDVWVGFYEQKADMGFMREEDSQKLFHYIRQKRYLPIVERIQNGQGLSIPVKKYISKEGVSKKRVVYMLPEDEANVMKLLTWLLIRKYDNVLSRNLYSFRPGVSVKSAMKQIVLHHGIQQYYSYKLDIRNYFNSINIPILLASLSEIFADDPKLYDFFANMLSDLRVVEDGKVICEDKGVMAGMPAAVFFANLYLTALDNVFDAMSDVLYCRYSDDIIVFAPDQEKLNKAKAVLHEYLRKFRLDINHDKEVETLPGERWTFLGFSYLNGEIDVSAVSVRKMKAKMRRKARALVRWKKIKRKDGWMAARAFIKHFNKKLYTSTDTHEINWSRWYFPLLTTNRSLKEIDVYMQDCIRYIVTERRTKSRYNFRYEQMKELGLMSLVNNWYSFRKRNRIDSMFYD